MKERNIIRPRISFVFILLACLSFKGGAQHSPSTVPVDTLIQAAREVIRATPFCALVTIDSTGQPQARTMNPFPLKDEWIIWFATNRNSRKVTEIRKNPKVCVYYADHNNAKGYISITGNAEVIDDKELLIRMKRDYWEGIPNWQEVFVLLKITPEVMDVINYERGISGDPKTNRAPTIIF